MSRDIYIARAAALQVAAAVRGGSHFFCEQLPPMDVDHFLAALAEETLDLGAVSLALVGYGHTEVDLKDRVSAVGLPLGYVTTDLHNAAKWRNEASDHPVIVALATGRHPGVSTLAHFPQGDSREFARDLLRWARGHEASLIATPPQAALLEALADDPTLSPLVSLNGVADFLAVWMDRRAVDEFDAPRGALPRLGLLPDRSLFEDTKAIAQRLATNFELTQQIAEMTGSAFDKIRRRASGRRGAIRTKHLDILRRAEELRHVRTFDAYAALDLSEAIEVFRPKKTKDKPGEPTPPVSPRPRDRLAVARDGGGLLVEGDNAQLTALVNCVRQALDDAIEDDEEAAIGQYDVNGEEQEFEFEVEREFMTWLHHFCAPRVWGGFFETPNTSFEDALRRYRQYEPILFKPLEVSIAHDGDTYDLAQLLAAMEHALQKQGTASTDLSDLWMRIVAARQSVLEHLDLLVHQPMLAVAGSTDLDNAVKDLLEHWERFYGKLAHYHWAMHEIDHAWTRLLFEAVASLDVVQIKTRLDADRTSWKAVLLPTHPLHLWRYERMAALARGLKPEDADRAAVLEQLEHPEHFLGVIYLTSLPAGKGGTQPLPVARDHRGLAVFENLRNAYSGDDGVEALQHCVRQFARIYVNHARPLRLALVNPPNASGMLVKLLARPRGRSTDQATLLVDIYVTNDHESRLLAARRFSTEDRDQIEEHIASGRLHLRVNDNILPLEERLDSLRRKPVHIVAVFDEASTAMKHQPAGAILLPMSPFAIRRRIEFLGIKKKVELRPSQEDSVFRAFYDMVGKLEDNRSGLTPQASADAEEMAQRIRGALVGSAPAAMWFFFADRALPSHGRVGAARILERQDRNRRSVCYDASYERLALLLRSPLDQFNVSFSPERLQDLLDEGVALLGDGLIDLFRADGQPDIALVRGFAGMLVAARDYRARHPDALLVSVDTRLARLWLRLTNTGQRCDLLAVRDDAGTIVVETVEVKTAGTPKGVGQREIREARDQLEATLDAIQSGLAEDNGSSPLAAPRQEMLKEVFVSGCQTLTASDTDRERWVGWLKVLFRQTEGAEEPRLEGIVYAVELSSNRPSRERSLATQPYELALRYLREARIRELLPPVADGTGTPGKEPQPPVNPPPSPPTSTAAGRAALSPKPSGEQRSPTPTARPEPPAPTRPAATQSTGIRFRVGHSARTGEQQPYHFHPSNTRLNQLNIGVVGDLGTGKTQLTKALIYQFTRQSAENRGHSPKFLIFDYKRDYTKADFVDAVGARVVAPHHIPLNVFDLRVPDRLPAARLGRFKFLYDALHKIYGGIGPRQRNHLKTAVMRAYDSKPDWAPTLADVFREYASVVDDRVDAPYSILSDLVDLEIFVERHEDAEPFDEFFSGVTVVDLAALGVGDKERNMLLVLLLNLYYEYMISLDKQPYLGRDPQLRFIDSMLLVDEADNIMRYNFEVLRQILLQGREFGVGVLLASQYLSHFRTRETDYSEPLLTWFVHKVPNVTPKELQSIGLNRVADSTVETVKALDVHHCLYKTFDVGGRIMRAHPFYEMAPTD